MPSINEYQGRTANQYIQFLGGTVDNVENNILNDGNKRKSSGGMSGMAREKDERDVQQITP